MTRTWTEMHKVSLYTSIDHVLDRNDQNLDIGAQGQPVHLHRPCVRNDQNLDIGAQGQPVHFHRS